MYLLKYFVLLLNNMQKNNNYYEKNSISDIDFTSIIAN